MLYNVFKYIGLGEFVLMMVAVVAVFAGLLYLSVTVKMRGEKIAVAVIAISFGIFLVVKGGI